MTKNEEKQLIEEYKYITLGVLYCHIHALIKEVLGSEIKITNISLIYLNDFWEFRIEINNGRIFTFNLSASDVCHIWLYIEYTDIGHDNKKGAGAVLANLNETKQPIEIESVMDSIRYLLYYLK